MTSGVQTLLVLLVAATALVTVSSAIGAFLLQMVTGMPRFKAFFATVQHAVTNGLFIVIGIEALFSLYMYRFDRILCWYYGYMHSCCPIPLGTDLFLHSSLMSLGLLFCCLTLAQWFFIKDDYAIKEWALVSILGLSTSAGCAAWFICISLGRIVYDAL